ncbi:hypothetical protein E1301_Tti023817 [Triplophysa tibetana]|uniref:Uncharacterized protein n=1 Tax=Triplophysa tibetana TaxID=1572043 RepID=A0A5A9NB26_9TELE|nr:hypothetical protein E1301_Tti023817 [Triplophysa tibetana]
MLCKPVFDSFVENKIRYFKKCHNGFVSIQLNSIQFSVDLSPLFLKISYFVSPLNILKIKTLTIITQPQVVPSLYKCLCSVEHKERYLEECKQLRILGHH